MRLTIVLVALLIWPLSALAQGFDSLELTLRLAREHAYRSAAVDWHRVAQDARAVAAAKGEHAAIRFVLKSLGDGHSFYRAPAHAPGGGPSPTAAAPKTPLSEVRPPVRGIPVIRINRWSLPAAEAPPAALALRSQLVEALSTPVCGIVLDFSANSGGNMWPTVVGLSPLLSTGTLGYFEDAHGAARAIEKRGTDILFQGVSQALNRATSAEPQHPAPRIAIVVGPRSSSAGELVPILFHGQHNVRLFGAATSGQSTSNSTFPLPNGGAANITTTVALDRHRTRFGGKIVPDVGSDEPVEAAAQWIEAECSRK